MRLPSIAKDTPASSKSGASYPSRTFGLGFATRSKRLMNRQQGRQTLAVVAVSGALAAGDISRVEEVLDGEIGPPVVVSVVQGHIVQHCARHLQRVIVIGIGRALVAHAGSETETIRPTFMDSVIEPQRGQRL